MLGKRASPVRREAVRKGPFWHLAGGPPYCPRRFGPGVAGKGPASRAPRRRPTSALWHNLAGHVEKTVAAHHRCVRDHYAALEQAAAQQAPDPGQLAGQATTAHAENRARVVRARERYEQVQALKAAGKNVTTVMRELRLAPGTARRYYRAASVDEVVAGTLTGWPSKLDDYKPFLHQRWNSGCTNIGQLHREITAEGYRRQLRHRLCLPQALQGPGRAARRPGAAQVATSPAGSCATPLP